MTRAWRICLEDVTSSRTVVLHMHLHHYKEPLPCPFLLDPKSTMAAAHPNEGAPPSNVASPSSPTCSTSFPPQFDSSTTISLVVTDDPLLPSSSLLSLLVPCSPLCALPLHSSLPSLPLRELSLVRAATSFAVLGSRASSHEGSSGSKKYKSRKQLAGS